MTTRQDQDFFNFAIGLFWFMLLVSFVLLRLSTGVHAQEDVATVVKPFETRITYILPTPTILPTTTPTQTPTPTPVFGQDTQRSVGVTSTVELAKYAGEDYVMTPVQAAIHNNFGKHAEAAKLVAKCESSLNPNIKSKISSASGLFQIVNGTWAQYRCTGNRFNPDDNARCAMKIFKGNGYSWNTIGGWAESYSCHKQK